MPVYRSCRGLHSTSTVHHSELSTLLDKLQQVLTCDGRAIGRKSSRILGLLGILGLSDAPYRRAASCRSQAVADGRCRLSRNARSLLSFRRRWCHRPARKHIDHVTGYPNSSPDRCISYFGRMLQRARPIDKRNQASAFVVLQYR